MRNKNLDKLVGASGRIETEMTKCHFAAHEATAVRLAGILEAKKQKD